VNCILRTGRRNARRHVRSVTYHMSLPTYADTQWTHSEVWLKFAPMPKCSFYIAEWQRGWKKWLCSQGATWNVTLHNDTGHRECHHRGVSGGNDGVCHVWWSNYAQTGIGFTYSNILNTLNQTLANQSYSKLDPCWMKELDIHFMMCKLCR